MKKIKESNIIYYIIAVVCAIAFFVHEFVDGESQEFQDEKAKYISVNKEKKAALAKVKEFAKESDVYMMYIKASEEEAIAKKNYTDFKKTENFLAFDTFQQFLGEFGWAFGLMLYCLFNFIIAVIKDRDSLIGEGVLHFSLLSVSAYYINWALFKFEDYQQIEYLIYSLLISIGLIFSTYVILKKRIKYIASLERKVQLGIEASHMLFNYLWDKKFLDYIKKDKDKEFRVSRLDITHKVVDNEHK